MNKERIIRAVLAAGLLFWSSSMNAQTNSASSQAPLYFSMQFPKWPALPGNPLSVQSYWLSNRVDGVPVYAYDDREVDYDELARARAESFGGNENESGSSAAYGPEDLWLEVLSVDLVGHLINLRLHGTEEGDNYQLLSTTSLLTPIDRWELGPIKSGSSGTNRTDFSSVSIGQNDQMFFRAHHANPYVTIHALQNAIEDIGQPGIFEITGSSLTGDLTVYYRISGVAQNGIDYTNLSGVATVPAIGSSGAVQIEVGPIQDNVVEFEETVTFTLIRTNSYLIFPGLESATITISDTTNYFVPVVTNLNTPVGIDFHAPSNSLVVSINQGQHGLPNNFALINSNGVVMTNWSGISGLDDEVKLALVRTGDSLTNAGGFTNGVMYFGTGEDGIVGALSADGTESRMHWSVLSTNGDNQTLLRGGLHVDQTGIWSNHLIVVTGNGPTDGGGVWRVNSSGQGTLVANITNTHLEGVITLTNDAARWGPWAGKIVTGGESVLPEPEIYVIDTNGYVSTNHFGIAPEDFDIIETNQDLYCVDYQGVSSTILKLSRTYLTNYVGDLVITQGGEFFGPAKLFFVHWDNSTSNIVIRSLSLPDIFAGKFEHAAFAPVDLPPIAVSIKL